MSPMPDGAPPRRARVRMPGWAMLASALLTAAVVNAVVTGQLPGVVTPNTVASLPVTLAAVPLTGTTVTAGTVASTTGFVPALLAVSTLTMSRSGTNDWDVKLAVTSASGITGGETLVVALVGASTQSISLNAASSYPQVTSALTLSGSGLSVTLATLSAISGCHSCSATVEVRITPSGGPLPSFVYPYTVATAA